MILKKNISQYFKSLGPFLLTIAFIIFCNFSGNIFADNGTFLVTVDPESNETKIVKQKRHYDLVSKPKDRVVFAEDSDTPVPSLAPSENEITLYLRDKGVLSETMGDPVPWLIGYVYPSGTTSREWEITLGGDITDFFYYQIDVLECPASARIKVEFIVDHDGDQTVVANRFIDLDPLPSGYYDPKTGTITALDLATQDGDRLIFKITHDSGSDVVGVGFDGVEAYNDSRIKIVQHGPVACFTADPMQGDLLTEFNVNASCSYDGSYPAANLEVRWDWENDGDYDTAYTTTKTASHKYSTSGIKSIKLQVKNPDGLTGTKIHEITIPIVIIDSFSTPDQAPAGLTWHGSHLWHSDGYDDMIFKLTSSGTVVNSFAAPCGDPMDMAWDGTNLWVIDAWGSDGEGNLVYKIDTSGAVIGDPVQVPVDISTGLTWDGHFLWGADGTNGVIRKLDPVTGNSIVGFRSPGYDPRGLAWDGQNLWNADFSGQKIYKFDVNGRILNTWPSPGSGPMGLTWDGKYLWSVDLNTHKIYKLADKIPTTITCELSKYSMTFGELLTVSGQISPPPDEAGKAVSIELTPPAGDMVYGVAFADITGAFDYTLDCGDIHRAGAWSVQTSWSGSGPFEGSTSDPEPLVLTKAETRVTLDASSQAIKLGDLVSIGGKFTPQPDCGSGLENIPLTIVISGPGGTDIQNVITNDPFGHFLLEDYAGFNQLGQWTIQVNFAGNDSYLSSNSDVMTVKVLETAGYAVIIQGKISNEEGLASHNKSTQFVYQTLKDRGLLDDDIQYFNYNTGQPGVDAKPSKAAIQSAITQWARNKMNVKPANLYIIMVDHGLDDFFYIHPDTISAVELDNWLDTLQGGLTGQAATQEIISILGFCRSGSFIDNLSGNHRVIVTSAAPGESSYKGPLDTDGIREGEYFINEFFKSVSLGKTLRQNFEEAVVLTESFTSSDSADSTNGPYFDNALQHPLLDDNADGMGSNLLSGQENDDGAISKKLVIGVSSITGNDPGDVHVTQVTDPVFLGAGTSSVGLIWGKVDDNNRLRTIWVEVKPPNYNPIDPGGSGQAEMNLAKIYGVYNGSTGRYEWTNLGGFNLSGTYQILYFAKDDLSGNVSPLRASTVYKAKAGNSPPNPFNLLTPANNATTLTELILDWEDTTDPNGDKLSYSVLLSEGNASFSNPIRKHGLAHSICLISDDDGLSDLTTYYWKVQAIDQYGAIRESGVRVFQTNNTNPPQTGWIYGYVFDFVTQQPIVNSQVYAGSIPLAVDQSGYYLGKIPAGTYTITVTANGYDTENIPNIFIPEGWVINKDVSLTPVSFTDADGDKIPDNIENATPCLKANDADTDDDGIIDGDEDTNRNGILDPGETDPCDPDSDGDGIQDGTELGYTMDDVGPDTNLAFFQPDLDPSTITNPLDEDTDGDGWMDGEEDTNQNGRVDDGEKDPNHFDIVCIMHIPLLLF